MSAQRKYKRAQDLEGAQRAAAMAEGNVVVAAGAGSGKTTVLAARYVRLIETGRMPGILPVGERVHVRNVLVLTFTRKAAAEMYARINGALAAASEEASESALKEGNGIVVPAGAGDGVAEHLAACLADFSQAQISTFDSFAARIARSGSRASASPRTSSVDEERAGKLARDLALSFILEHREEDAIRDLVSAAGLEGARDDILADLAVHRMSLSSPPDFAGLPRAAGRAPRRDGRRGPRGHPLDARGRLGLCALRDDAYVQGLARRSGDQSRRRGPRRDG
jgi:ATP-dependent exoDNAse (exonuclease V) beta subunit